MMCHPLHAQRANQLNNTALGCALCGLSRDSNQTRHASQSLTKGVKATHRVKGKKQTVTMPMAGKTKAHIKQLMHRLFEKATLWDFVPPARNPMDLMELRGVTRRQKRPLILTPEEYEKVQSRLPQPYRTMAAVAMCLRLRVSEVLGLKWSDFDFDALTVTVQRGLVHGRIADTKTEASTDELPLDPYVRRVAEGMADEGS
jgi:integrase